MEKISIVAIHTNLGLANQRESAHWLRRGFRRHGIDAEITADREKLADVQVVQGPWYCRDYWKPRSGEHPVIWLDCSFYGDSRYDLSLGWLRPDGSRDFCNADKTEPNGRPPALQPRKRRQRTAIVFQDYGRDMTETVAEARLRFDAVYYRPHPQSLNGCPRAMSLGGDLAATWTLGDVALGHSSTVLVKAAIAGLTVESSDPRHVIHDLNGSRQDWLNRLSWAQWGHEQIQSGLFWEHLREGMQFTSH